MVFNGDSDDQDICTLADLLVKTDDTDFPLKEKAMYANWGLREILKVVMQVYGGWIPNDPGTAGAPEYTANLTNATQIYALATAQMLFGLEYSDSNGIWTDLKPITLEEIHDMGYAETEFMKTTGNPIYFRAVGNGVKIYPGWSGSTVTNGLKAHILYDISFAF